ncbi:ABC-type multidrug transport system, ATPase and permease component [Desulfocapsa sulfexigens DSM 10523]|uniref:ABC-type multidrug transport system, ATPase and permease component n=1 Tax=Desulfocapsa sulfexigens (strain DSM 10523 / SB164P1) TaxID=1167006 RepID=M1NC06_DESSD|nr:ABC transporter ATP-binding protein [Desulfocapsa sulfexigens]AGF77329.1 ABC-type multidrug transport system, ATPase and permease component [Desulfocapsa sulfexigens DSM 10523]
MRNFGYFEEDYTPKLSEKGLWRRILGYIHPFRIPFTGAILLSLFVTVSALGLPWIMQRAIDLYITSPMLDFELRMTGLSTSVMLYGGLMLIGFVTAFLQVLLLEWIGQSIMHRLRQDLFSHLLQVELQFFNTQPVGRLVTRLTNDVQNMHEMFTSIMVTIFNDLLRMCGILVLLLYMNIRLGLLLCLFVPLAVVVTILFSRLARNHFRAIRKQLSKVNAFVQEAVSGVSLVQLFGRSSDLKRKFAGLNDDYMTKTLRQIRLFGTFMPITELMSSLAVALILWYGGGEIIRKQLTLGELVAFLSYMRLFFQPLRELSQKYSIVQSALASAERIFHLLDTDTEEQNISEAEKNSPLSLDGELCFNEVNFSYLPDQPVLHDISFTVKKGETIAIVGATGSGKSTLLNLMLRFYEPDSGTISLGAHFLTDVPKKTLRREIGVVMQEMLILQDTLLNNIVLDTGKSRKEVTELLQQTQLIEFVTNLSMGLDTLIGEGGQAMSTGEKQLLAIARVLCRNPSLLVLDEASSAIDSKTEKLLERPLEHCFKDKTVLIIAHRLSTVQRADRIIVLDKGRIMEHGSHASLLARDGIYRKLVALDFGSGIS